MLSPTGSFAINGITDAELVKILEIKIRHEGAFTFNPQQLQPTMAAPRPGAAPVPCYNNVLFNWSTEKGLDAVHEVIGYLLKKEERREAVGQ